MRSLVDLLELPQLISLAERMLNQDCDMLWGDSKKRQWLF
jgi:hypothetical protein